MNISAQDVMALRNRTGASMMAVKKALVEAAGDNDKAIELLMKRGEAKAAEKGDRTAGEGAIAIATTDNKAGLVKLNCETDFVARNDEFIAAAEKLAGEALNNGADATEKMFEEVKPELFTKMGENLQLSATDVVEGPVVGSYVHTNRKIGVVVVLDSGTTDQAKDVAMHAAAMSPAVVNPSEVTQEAVDKQKVIWADQLKEEGKPAEMIDKIMMGKEKKFREEHALMTQPFVKDQNQTVQQYLGDAKITQFVRLAV
jgi:elongation factor Ts